MSAAKQGGGWQQYTSKPIVYVIRRKETSTTCGLIGGHIVDGHVWIGNHG
jgi:hypothetical protein